LVELNSLIVDDLRGTLPNPHSPSNWIYLDYPRCFTEDVEVLTKEGWHHISQIRNGDRILGFDPIDCSLHFTPVLDIIQEFYRGEIIQFHSPQLELGLTPNHKILVSYGTHRQKKWVTASKLTNSMYIPRKGTWKGNAQRIITIPEYVYKSKNQYREFKKKIPAFPLSMHQFLGLLGLYLSEGTINKHNYLIISQTKKESRKLIQKFLEKTELRFAIGEKEFAVTDPRIGAFISQWKADCYHKFIPRKFLSLSPEYLETLLYWLLVGDGSKISKSKTGMEYYTTSRQLADDVYELILKIGKTPRMRIKLPKKGEPCYAIKFYSRFLNLKVRNHFHLKPYEGLVFCLSTENGTLIVRNQKGQVFFSGNSDATFPRISVTQISASISELGIGENIGQTTGRLVSIDYDIDIWIKISDRFIINGTTYVGTALRDKYADLVLEALEALKPQWKAEDGIVDVEIANIATEALDEENELHRKTITIRVTFIWED